MNQDEKNYINDLINTKISVHQDYYHNDDSIPVFFHCPVCVRQTLAKRVVRDHNMLNLGGIDQKIYNSNLTDRLCLTCGKTFTMVNNWQELKQVENE